MQDPETYLQRNHLTMTCPVRPDRPAVIDPALRVQVNHEIYYVSDAGAVKRFRKDPLRYCGTLTDAVSLLRFRPTKTSPRHEHGGRRWYFSADSTRARFAALPDSFAARRGG